MKKLTAFLIGLAIVAMMVSCSENGLPSTKFVPGQSGPSQSAPIATTGTVMPSQTTPKATSGPTVPSQITQPTTVPAPTQTTAPAIPEIWHEFSFVRFLTDVNRTGSIAVGGELEAPGAPPSVERIPAADQSMVGESVMIVFAQEQQAIPFYYICDETTGLERLVVIVTAERIPLLIVFETALGGAEVLCEKMALQQEFPAKILAVTNISHQEGNVYACNAGESMYGIAKEEIVDIFSAGELPLYGQYVGIFGQGSNGSLLCVMKGSNSDTVSKELQNDFDVFLRIIDRFSLGESIS